MGRKKRKQAKVFDYQYQWLHSPRTELNLSQLTRQWLTGLAPESRIPDDYDDSNARHPPTPVLGYGGGAGYCDIKKERVHLTLAGWQKEWVQSDPTLSFSVLLQGQLDRRMPLEEIPEQRRQSLVDIGVLDEPEDRQAGGEHATSTVEQPVQNPDTSQNHD